MIWYLMLCCLLCTACFFHEPYQVIAGVHFENDSTVCVTFFEGKKGYEDYIQDQERVVIQKHISVSNGHTKDVLVQSVNDTGAYGKKFFNDAVDGTCEKRGDLFIMFGEGVFYMHDVSKKIFFSGRVSLNVEFSSTGEHYFSESAISKTKERGGWYDFPNQIIYVDDEIDSIFKISTEGNWLLRSSLATPFVNDTIRPIVDTHGPFFGSHLDFVDTDTYMFRSAITGAYMVESFSDLISGSRTHQLVHFELPDRVHAIGFNSRNNSSVYATKAEVWLVDSLGEKQYVSGIEY